jgi:hypothetical protein
VVAVIASYPEPATAQSGLFAMCVRVHNNLVPPTGINSPDRTMLRHLRLILNVLVSRCSSYPTWQQDLCSIVAMLVGLNTAANADRSSTLHPLLLSSFPFAVLSAMRWCKNLNASAEHP